MTSEVYKKEENSYLICDSLDSEKNKDVIKEIFYGNHKEVKEVDDAIRGKLESAKSLNDVQIRSEFIFKVKLLAELIQEIDEKGVKMQTFRDFLNKNKLEPYVYLGLLSKLEDMDVIPGEERKRFKMLAGHNYWNLLTTKKEFVELSKKIKFYKYTDIDIGFESLKCGYYIIKNDSERLVIPNYNKYENLKLLAKLEELIEESPKSFEGMKDMEEINEDMSDEMLRCIMDLNKDEKNIKTLDDLKKEIDGLDRKGATKFYIFTGDRIEDISSVQVIIDDNKNDYYIFNQPKDFNQQSAKKIKHILSKEGFEELKKDEIDRKMKRYILLHGISKEEYSNLVLAVKYETNFNQGTGYSEGNFEITNGIAAEAFDLIGNSDEGEIDKKVAEKVSSANGKDKGAWKYVQHYVSYNGKQLPYWRIISGEELEKELESNEYYKFKDEELCSDVKKIKIGEAEEGKTKFLIYRVPNYRDISYLKWINRVYNIKPDDDKIEKIEKVPEDARSTILYPYFNSLEGFLNCYGDFAEFSNKELAEIYEVIEGRKKIEDLSFGNKTDLKALAQKLIKQYKDSLGDAK